MKSVRRKKPSIKSLMRDTSSSFHKTGLGKQAEMLRVFCDRVSKLEADFREVLNILQWVKERHLVPKSRRMLRGRLQRMVSFSKALAETKLVDQNALELLMLDLETEVAAVDPAFNILRGIHRYRSSAYKGKR